MEFNPKQNERIILLKVGKINRENIYEQTRKYWKLSLERAQEATCVLSVIDNVIAAAFIPEFWKHTDNMQYEGRCEFVGHEWEKCPYIGCDVTHLYKKGSANPVKYINM